MPPTEMRDELPVPHFEDRLWQVLSDAHPARHRDGPPREGSAVHGRSRLRRGRGLLAAGIGSLAAAAVVIAAVAVVGSSGSDDATGLATDQAGGTGGGAVPSGTPAEVDLAAKITAATRDALADSVVHTVQDFTGPGDSESWSDETSGAWRLLQFTEDDAPSMDHGMLEPPAVDAAAPPPIPEPPDHCNWTAAAQLTDEGASVDELPDCPPALPPDHPTVPTRTVDYCFEEYIESEMPALPARNEAEAVGEDLAAGKLVEDGTEIVDGRELIRLRTAGDALGHVYFVEPDTYRPVLIHGYPDDLDVPLYVMTFDYLARTPDNLALFVAPIPGGFTVADQLHADGERLDAGCGF
jgi:hypothetical protein